MKNKTHLVLLAAGTLLGSLSLAACGNTPTDSSSSEVIVSSSESTVKEYTVTFDSNGGSSVASQTIKEGELVVEPTNPTKDGYTFTNWTYNSQVWNFATDKVTQDMTLLANYTENAYGYAGTFVTDSNCSIQYIEKQSDTEYINLGSDNVAYSRDGDTGELSHDGTGQINFKVVCKDGYTVDTVTVTQRKTTTTAN